MKNKLLTLASMFICCVVFSQKKSTTTLDSIKVNRLLKKIEALTDIDESKKSNDLVLKICKEKIADTTVKKSQRKFFVDSYLTSLLSEAYFEEQKGNAKKSIELNLFVLKLAEKQKNHKIQGYANLALGSIFALMPDYNKAEHYYKKALKNCEDDNNEMAIARICSNLTYVYIKTNNTKEATIYLQKALRINQKLNNKSGISSGLMGLAKIYWMNKNYSEAKKKYLNAIQIQNETKDFSASANAYKNLYKVEQESGNLSQSILYLNKSNELSIQTNNSNEIIETSRILYEHFKKQNNYKKALFYYEKAIVEESKINREEFNNSILKAEFKYETEKKEAQIKALSQQKKISDLENQRQKSVILVVVILFFSITMISLLLFKRYKSRKENELLKVSLAETEKTLIAEKKAAESELKALKSQMNPHFIFNALNSIQEQFMFGDKLQANEQMGNFTNLTRQILSISGKKKITLATEIDILTKYLELEKMRFGDDFDYQITVANELDEECIEVPPMMIQPFAENSIKHGLLHQTGTKSLNISFELRDEKVLVCTIEDNGIGREQSAIIQNRNKHNAFSTNAIAQRLELLNQAEHKKNLLQYEDLKDANGKATGTRVVLQIYL